ncbi:MAG: DUF2029 domain-containing protein, partial [Gemmatimonadetes bacterium]|nr:DUF2029 domain-containing protein [Gemmatimonadota bacterium]
MILDLDGPRPWGQPLFPCPDRQDLQGARDSPPPLILLYSLGFVPFSLNTLLGGQISWLGLAIFAMVGTAISNRKPFLAGLVMSLSYYKPPLFLLLLIVLLLSQGRRFFWGFAVGAT